MPKIYESPDGGNTIYERESGQMDRTLVKENKTLIEQIRESAMWGEINRMARTNPGLQAELDRVIMFYNLIKNHEQRRR